MESFHSLRSECNWIESAEQLNRIKFHELNALWTRFHAFKIQIYRVNLD